MMVSQSGSQAACRRQAVTNGCKVTWAASRQRQACQCSLEIRRLRKGRPEFATQLRIIDKHLDGIQAPGDGGGVGQRCGQPLSEQAGAWRTGGASLGKRPFWVSST